MVLHRSPGPSGSPSARGARMSASCALAAHVLHQRVRHAPACRPLGSRPKLVSHKGCGDCGGCGSDMIQQRRACPGRCMRAPNYGRPCSCGHDPPALYLCTGPYLKNPPINPTHHGGAARTTGSQRFLNSSSCEISTDSYTTAPVIQLDLHNRNMSHRVQQLGNTCGPTSSLGLGKTSAPRRGNEPARPAQQGHRPPKIEQQLGHGELPLRNERDVDDRDGLQLRRLRSFLQSDHRHHVETVLRVHSGRDVEHHGPANRGTQREVHCNQQNQHCTCHCNSPSDPRRP